MNLGKHMSNEDPIDADAGAPAAAAAAGEADTVAAVDATEEGPGRRRRTKAIVWTTAGILATAIGAASIAIPMIADAQRRSTSTDTLVVDPTTEPEAAALATSAPLAAAAVDPGLDFTEQDTIPVDDGAGADMTFWVPVDAPWATFPDDGWQQEGTANGYGCSQAQYEWLVDHAVSKPTMGGLYDFVNSATDGGALSIRSIRAEGEFVPQTPARIQVSCEGPGYGEGNDYTVIDVALGADAPATVTASSVLPVGSLFARDLAPGEMGTIVLQISTLDPQQDFEGRIVADVVAGTEESTVVIEEGVLWRSAPAVRSGVVHISMIDGVLRCMPLTVTEPLFEESEWGGGPYSTMKGFFEPSEGMPCTPADLATWIGGLPVEY